MSDGVGLAALKAIKIYETEKNNHRSTANLFDKAVTVAEGALLVQSTISRWDWEKDEVSNVMVGYLFKMSAVGGAFGTHSTQL